MTFASYQVSLTIGKLCVVASGRSIGSCDLPFIFPLPPVPFGWVLLEVPPIPTTTALFWCSDSAWAPFFCVVPVSPTCSLAKLVLEMLSLGLVKITLFFYSR